MDLDVTPKINYRNGTTTLGGSDCISSGLIKGGITVLYNGDCNTFGTYNCDLQFQLGFGTGATMLNQNSLTATITYTVGGVNKTLTSSVSYLGKSGALYLFESDFQLSDYCSMTTMTVTVTPSVICQDENTYTEDMSLTKDIASTRTNACLNAAPLFVSTGSTGQLVLGGWIYPCTNPAYDPCVSFPDEVYFNYRKSGTTSWSTYTLNPYLDNGWIISGLSSGSTYEYFWQNVKVSPPCTGPSTQIKTITLH